MSDPMKWVVDFSIALSMTLVYMSFIAYYSPRIISDFNGYPIAQTLYVGVLAITAVGVPILVMENTILEGYKDD